MPAYDSVGFAPPAPTITVSLRNADTGLFVENVALLIDTGAYVTLLPRRILEQLGVNLIQEIQYELTGFDGSTTQADAVQLEMLFLGKMFRGRFLLVDGDIGILGRNVLNLLRIYLDGPGLNWESS